MCDIDRQLAKRGERERVKCQCRGNGVRGRVKSGCFKLKPSKPLTGPAAAVAKDLSESKHRSVGVCALGENRRQQPKGRGVGCSAQQRSVSNMVQLLWMRMREDCHAVGC